MKTFILAGLLYFSVGIVLAFEIVGLMSIYQAHNWNLVEGIFGICLPLAYIVGLAVEGLLGTK